MFHILPPFLHHFHHLPPVLEQLIPWSQVPSLSFTPSSLLVALKKMLILDKISDLIPLMFEIPEYSLPPPHWLKHKGHIVWHVMQSPPHLVYITIITSTQEIKPVNTKGEQAWLFIGRTNAEAEAPVLWAPDMTSWLFGKDPDAGKDWRQEKGVTEDEMVGWHHWLNGHEFERAPGDDEG